MDMLEVFLKQHIQPLQARDHPMWMYSGIEDSTWIHPEEVDKDMVEKWLKGITATRITPGGPGESLHSTIRANQTRSDSGLPSVLLIHHVIAC